MPNIPGDWLDLLWEWLGDMFRGSSDGGRDLTPERDWIPLLGRAGVRQDAPDPGRRGAIVISSL